MKMVRGIQKFSLFILISTTVTALPVASNPKQKHEILENVQIEVNGQSFFAHADGQNNDVIDIYDDDNDIRDSTNRVINDSIVGENYAVGAKHMRTLRQAHHSTSVDLIAVEDDVKDELTVNGRKGWEEDLDRLNKDSKQPLGKQTIGRRSVENVSDDDEKKPQVGKKNGKKNIGKNGNQGKNKGGRNKQVGKNENKKFVGNRNKNGKNKDKKPIVDNRPPRIPGVEGDKHIAWLDRERPMMDQKENDLLHKGLDWGIIRWPVMLGMVAAIGLFFVLIKKVPI